MKTPLNRRQFVSRSATASAAVATFSILPAVRGQDSPGNRIVAGVIGLSRGMAHVAGHLAVKGVEVGYVCDVDTRRAAGGAKRVTDTVASKQLTQPPVKAVDDFRRILEDKQVDVISIAMPNFWHTPAAILAMQAGKHVYVEKPGSHNWRETELIVAAAIKYKRKVQMGNQRRSYPIVIEGIQRLRAGDIGPLRYSRSYYSGGRPSIGKGKPAPMPEWLNWELWQGPAPERPFKDNLLHYNWHWHWHYGGGELANNGIHALDVCRWGLGVDFPRRVSFVGGRYHHQDDQETPDTGAAVFDFGHCGVSWDVSSCNPRKGEKGDALPFVSFYGDKGSMTMSGGNEYTIYDLNGKVIDKKTAPASDVPHFQNLADAIREDKKLNSDITDVQKGSLMCHLGNIAYRTGHTLDIDPKNGHILNDPAAEKLWGREYRPGWEPKV